MPIHVTNSLTRKKELFQPMKDGEVRMYVCGPTVYGFIHVGNARPVVFYDVVRRYLEKQGYQVQHVSNFTDVDDKIIERARQEKKPWKTITDTYTAEYLKDCASLKVLEPQRRPKVSEHIPQIIKLIERLVENGSAYVVEGEVFFSVRRFKPYGALSGKNIDDLLAGARVEVDAAKKDPLDFSLWKPQKAEDEPAWDSPWGKGRPGWHIECSVMAMEYLGETFDLHGGGMDLIHPHHENEIAQSEAATGKPFVRYWMHNNMLNMDSQKMSKSLGNTVLAREFVEKYSAETLKFMIVSGHYRSVIDFSEQHIRESQSALHRYYSTLKKCEQLSQGTPKPGKGPTTEENTAAKMGTEFPSRFQEAMDDDFNTAKVIGHVFEYVRAVNAFTDRKGFQLTETAKTTAAKFVENMRLVASVLNTLGEPSGAFLIDLRTRILSERNLSKDEIQKIVDERVVARQSKDFQKADALRSKLVQMGIEVQDSPTGTEWDVMVQSTST